MTASLLLLRDEIEILRGNPINWNFPDVEMVEMNLNK